MVTGKSDENDDVEGFFEMPLLEEVLPAYFGAAIYSGYLAKDMLDRLGERASQVELPIESMADHDELRLFCSYVVEVTGKILGSFGVDYSLVPHPTAPDKIKLTTESYAGGFTKAEQPHRTGSFPMASAMSDSLEIFLVSRVTDTRQRLETILAQQRFIRQSTN